MALTSYSLTLAATWNPRGELPRLLKLLPQLEQVYAAIVISFPPGVDRQVVSQLERSDLAASGRLLVWVNAEWGRGRYAALEKSLDTSSRAVQYADMDRLLRWVETRALEWRQTAEKIGPDGPRPSDCLIVGRTPAAYATHPQALIQTEAISNRVTSAFLGQAVDVSAGSKGFSRRAVEYLVQHSEPQRALGADAAWPVLLRRAGFGIDYVEVDGLDWESADRYQAQAADRAMQVQLAQVYDADPQHWAMRVSVAMEIVACALDAWRQNIPAVADYISKEAF